MTLVAELLKATALMVALISLFMLVQRPWRRAFPKAAAELFDPVTGRPGCGGCAHQDTCTTQPATSPRARPAAPARRAPATEPCHTAFDPGAEPCA